MMVNNPKKVMLGLSILTVFIGIIAVALVIVAIERQEYVIASAMALVALWQVYNFISWRKLR